MLRLAPKIRPILPVYPALRGVAGCALALALAQFLTLAAQGPKPPAPAAKGSSRLLQEAQEAINRKDFPAATKALKEVVAADPKSAPAWFNLGYAYTGLHEDENARQAYQKTVQLAPDLFEARLNLGILLLQMRQPGAALEHLAKAVSLRPEHARAHLYYARALSQAGQAEPAEKQFQEALRLDARMAIADYDLGQLYLEEKRHQEALTAFQKAAALDASLTEAQLGMALASEGVNDTAQAVAHFESYLAAHPQDLETRFHLARLYLQQGKNERALEDLQTVYRAQPNTPGLAAALGDVYALLKKFPESEKFYREALTTSSGEADLHRALGQTLLDEQKYPEAEEQFRGALKLDSRNRDAARGLATSLYLEKRYPEAIPLLEALARAPDPPPVLFFMLATSYDDLQLRDKALAAYEHFLEVSHGQSPDQEWQARQRAKLLRRMLRK